MAFAICGTETVTIKQFFAMARINACFNVCFSISTNSVNKKVILGSSVGFPLNHSYEHIYCSQ